MTTERWQQVGALLLGGLAFAAVASGGSPAVPPAPRPQPARPGRFRITSPYGMRFHPILKVPRMHEGIDLGLPQGTPLYPVGPGKVIGVRLNEGAGGTSVTVQHGRDWRTSYSHLSRVDVRPGQPVARQTSIGASGGLPGTWGAGRSTGPHLHMQAWRRTAGGWQLVDPAPLIHWS